MGNLSALNGIKVLDLSRVLGGPFAGQVLADHGAEVIKIEPPMGDETRMWGPPFKEGSAAYFSGINRNKRGMALDLRTEEGREILLKLLATTDVLIENFKIGTLEKWGIGFKEVLSKKFPRLIQCRISGFGEDGPLGGLPGYDSIIQAMSGLMSVNGTKESGPIRVGLPIVDMVTGMNAVIGILMALQERERSEQGQFVEASLYDSGMTLLQPHIPNYLWSGELPQLTGSAHPNIAPYDTYETKTSQIFIAVGNDRQFQKLCEVLAADEISKDARFKDNASRSKNREALKQLLEKYLSHHDGREISETLIHQGVPCSSILNVAEIIDHPHTKHSEMIVSIGDYQGIGSPIKLSRTPASYRLAPPKFGEESLSILQEEGFSSKEIKALQEKEIIK
ncbi:CoA transferase [Ignatzschineria rhizosphaerae]|uniref:CoA transferase n=1 Tax=Ignatzschineria rhizosphaerae TaxID=2923279 RepID=A0ABY3X539_9GAMM|nr:CoA transferase [Ignatzschineria rhizosphaerae]UNM96844.1 CoA transferase [Ignatzschineria rhizosphaerae]